MSDEAVYLLREINELDERLRKDSKQLLSKRIKWLKMNGWEVEEHLVGPTITRLYRKNGELLICEHDAIDMEIHG